nr:UDP-N-acetylmuramate dehydrogenase [Helicobacter kayseriensis]
MQKVIDFSKHTSLKIGGEHCVRILEEVGKDFDERLIGGGNNILLSPDAKSLCMLGKQFDYIKDQGDWIEIGGATSSGKIYSFFKKNNLWGVEFLRGLPGKLGGLVRMNAGMKSYEMKDALSSVYVDGVWKSIDQFDFKYRQSGIDGVIYGARFKKITGFRYELIESFENMRQTHPHLPSCGSCFKNPHGDYAGRLLESVGLKGYSLGGVGFSQSHANFLVNLGNGKFDEAMKLISLAQKRVWEEHGIFLECEVIILK